MATIGLSKPYYALYSNSGSSVTYSSGGVAGKYTEMSLSLTEGENNDFYADDAIAETDLGFSGGSVSVTTDDLRPAIAKAILGLTETSISTTGVTTTSPKWQEFDDRQAIPFVGFGGVIKKKVDSSVKYQAFILPKIKFRNPNVAAVTQGQSIEWQAQQLTADISRSDATNHPWFRLSTLLDTEADAILVIKDVLGIT